MRAKRYIASLSLALLSALQAAAGNVQDQGRTQIVHSLQSPPAGFSCAAVKQVQLYKIVDASGRSIKPGSVAAVGNDLYFLGPAQLWRCRDAVLLLKQKDKCPVLTCTELYPAMHKVNNVPVQEFCDFVAYPAHKSLIVLEKSGDLLEFHPASNTWCIAWPNKPITYSPDPDFISLTSLPDAIVLLDPERNELWRFDGKYLIRLITPEVLPWKTRRSKPSLTDGLVACADNQSVFVLKRSGAVTEYGGKRNFRAFRQLNCKPLEWLRPTRVCNGPASLLIIDREHNALVELNKRCGGVRVQFFPSGSDLRGLCAVPGGLCIIDGDNLVCLPPSMSAASTQTQNLYTSRPLDPGLQKLKLPIYHSHLPSHPGVWPGARRLYRYGVHKGVDFFYDTGCGIAIKTGTPVCAAAAGRIVRIDNNFKDLSEKQYARIIKECVSSHSTSDSNEDLLRGCQVWIDHGDGLLTKYAHLDHVNHKLHKGDWVKCGSVIGCVGVSGTGENLPGHVRQPHLHFEIWLDGNYLGYGLTPAETIVVFERIFGCGC